MKRRPIVAKWVLLAGFCALLILASADAARATVRYVDGSRPSSGTGLSWAEAFKTIQEAVDAALANDEIWIKQGTYNLASPIALSQPVSLFGGFDGTELSLSQRDWVNNVTVIDGLGTAGCFTVTSDVTFDGLSINNGKPAMAVPSSVSIAIHPVIANCRFSGNSADEGGALSIVSYRSILQITNTRFENNTATDRGGAIYNYGGELNIQECEFVNNKALPDGNIANGGGAIYNDGSYALPICTITNSSFNSNRASSQGGVIVNHKAIGVIANSSFSVNESGQNGGGAIYNRFSAFTINACEFTSNTAFWGGGAINNTESPTVIQNSTFTDNHSDYTGGAIWNWQSQTSDPPKIINCVFSGNSTDGAGGAISNSWSAPNITNCTFSSNSSATSGGAIYNGGHTFDNKHPKITNCILWNDTAPAGPEIGNTDSTPTVTYCDVQGGYTGTGNKNLDPLLATDLRLVPGSPCLDAGTNSAPDIPSTDKDGNPRIIDWDRNGVATADMGAYEHAALAYQPHSGTINSENWGPGTHYVTASVTVSNNQVLTIQPGAVVKFAPNTQLIVYGTLHASGTGAASDSSIVFTSRDDDSYGEIILGSDGTPAAGDWYGIYLYGSSTQQGIGEFDYCVFRYGGNSSGLADANVYFYYSDSGYMANCISEHSAQHGVRIYTCSPQITDSEFRDNVQSGLYASGAGALTITGNAFNNNGQYGAYVNLASVNPVISGNTGSGNQTNGFVFGGTVGADQTWASMPGFPIVLLSTVTVADNVRLTIAAGTVVKFDTACQLTVYGTLDANGTDGNWVVFTSLKDDVYGGDTNGDGAATLPAAGDWYGIYLYGSSTQQGIGEFDYCVFRYGGNSSGLADANVCFYYSDSGYMANCISEHSAQHGVRIYSCPPLIANTTISQNESYGVAVSSGSPRIINSIVWDNTAGGISGTPVVAYSDIQGGFAGEGNINEDPQFLDPAGGDYRLDVCSPAVDAGDPVETLTADYTPGTLVINVDQVTAVLPESKVWITDGVNTEGDVVVSTSPTAITVANGFANSYTVANRSYLFTFTSDYYGEPEPNGRRIDMGAYGGSSEAFSPNSCRADLAGGDQDVDGSDLSDFITAFGANSPAADLNNDGVVNAADLAVFAEEFGRTDCAICP